MTANGWLQILLFSLAVFAVTKPLGIYMFRVFEGDGQPLPRLFGPIERAIYRLGGVDEKREQTWRQYALSVLFFSLFGVVVTYLIQRVQGTLPLNPQGMAGVEPSSAWNTAVSFVTNTNWQGYVGEATMSYFTQMAGLAWHNFVSAGTGMGVALAVARGITRRPGPDGADGLGNFWVDLTRSLVYVLLPMSLLFMLVLMSQGVIQNFAPYLEVKTLEGAKQLIAMGPVASQEVIKQLGTNGGGFFNANSAHPYENPTAIANFVAMWLIFAIPAALTYTYGRMAREARQGWALFAAMGLLFAVGVTTAYAFEAGGNPVVRGLDVAATGNMEGKEVRFGITNSALFATVTTDASCGAVNAMHDSFTPIGGLVPLFNIQLSEVVFGGVGAGLYGMLVFVVFSVFIAGLMVGRTPELLGKKIEAREMALAVIYILVFPALILGFSAWASVAPYGVSSLNNAGPHGLSEMLYAFTSATGNNGSAFAGISANTPFYNTTLGLAMLFGRFAMIVPVLAIAGSLLRKKVVAAGPGTFPTNGALFVGLLLGVIVIVGALTFLPVLTLGPIAEHFLAANGRLY